MKKLASVALITLFFSVSEECLSYHHANLRYYTYEDTSTREETIVTVLALDPQQVEIPDPVTEDPPRVTTWVWPVIYNASNVEQTSPECQPINLSTSDGVWSGI